ncbi:MAG: putative amidase [uncultured Nocardioidaceae bacterium]|uniref:Putative amidase n=1 Tax=uncultured Nocardioidaceae bacterium TaxID=253824 RepID=A0A6J4MIW5_9ACTN|nr:MAG: putative amidase [uncultured Nocardioidaceae bacterium]
MSELHDLGGLELSAAYRRGDTSPVEVVDHLLDRIAQWNEAVGAFVTLTADPARAQARLATERLSSGEPIPALLGVPTAIKDLNNTDGVRTTYGSAVFAEHVPDFSDEVVLRLEAGGLISLGKTSTPEFGSPCYTEPDVAPPARTPYDRSRSAGGSSGGAAAAVASGLVPLAQGSDGGGSIRIPASVCGLVGLKPTRGRVSAAPVHGDISGLGIAGPLARTVADAAVLLDVLAGPAAGDAVWAPAPTRSFLHACSRDPGRLRVARFATPTISDSGVDDQVLAAYEDATRLLVELGHDVVDIEPPLPREVLSVFETVWAVGAASIPVPPEQEPRLRPLSRWLRGRGRSVEAPVYAGALVAMRQAAARALVALAPYDVVLTPTLAALPAPVGGLRNDADPAADFAAQVAYTPFTAGWNVTGMPAVSLPLAWSREGLPIGIMLAARPAQEELLLSVSAQVERHVDPAGGWARPPLPLTPAAG